MDIEIKINTTTKIMTDNNKCYLHHNSYTTIFKEIAINKYDLCNKRHCLSFYDERSNYLGLLRVIIKEDVMSQILSVFKENTDGFLELKKVS